ncbi:MAG: restriction endonuclease subunit S [Candidatus Nanopelagicales bacterium]|nr:restriction endonuclease subunit S [Candidatus Nanopelagicales bacterium]
MSEGWTRVALGGLLTQVREAESLDEGREYPLLGMRMYGGGPYLRETVTSDNSKASRLYRVSRGQFIYNRMFAWGGAFGLVPLEFDGAYVSNEFPVFACHEDLLGDYLRLWFQQPTVWQEIESRSTGTTKSRTRFKEQDLARYALPLPPLAVQRRIVDLMEHLDNQVNQAVASQQAASRLLHRFLDEWVASSPAGEQSVGDLCKFRSGPSWAAADEATVPGADRTPVVKITNTRPDGTLDLQQLVYVRGLPASGHRLDDNSLIVIRTNGNRDRIGNVYRPSEDAIGCAVSAFQFSGSALSTTSRDFLYWFLKAPSTQQSMSEAASGTTGLGNLAARWLNSLPIPAAGNEEIKEFVAIANCLGHLSDVLLSEHAALTDLRGACLQALLSGQVTLPASYDELLGVAS